MMADDRLPWSRQDLAAWQARIGCENSAEAARRLRLPYKTYLSHLPGGKYRSVSETLRLLCLYIEHYGPLPGESFDSTKAARRDWHLQRRRRHA